MVATAPTQLLVVDGHEVVREGIGAALRSDRRFAIAGSTGSPRDALATTRRIALDIAVVGWQSEMSGTEMCRKLRECTPSLAILMLGTNASETAVRAAIEAGATALVSRDDGLDALRDVLAAMRRPAAGAEPQIVRRLYQLLSERPGDAALTSRQALILTLTASGLFYSEIAERLFMSEGNVRLCVEELKRVVGARSKTDLVAKAMFAGLISDSSESGHNR